MRRGSQGIKQEKAGQIAGPDAGRGSWRLCMLGAGDEFARPFPYSAGVERPRILHGRTMPGWAAQLGRARMDCAVWQAPGLASE